MSVETSEPLPSLLPIDATLLRDVLSQARLRLTGEIVPLRGAGNCGVWAVPTLHETLYLKIVPSVFAHEPILTETLAERYPDWLPRLMFCEPHAGWLLMHDAGTPLRIRLQQTGKVALWHAPLEQMAQLQQAEIPHASLLKSIRVMHWQLSILPDRLDEMLRDPPALYELIEDFGEAEIARLNELKPTFAALCRRLADFRLPETLHHDDFHCANIYLDGEYIRFADWGESGIGHPFFTPQISLNIAESILQIPHDDLAITRMQDAYLDCWTDWLSPAELREAFDLARTVHRVARAATWHTLALRAAGNERRSMMTSVRDWLKGFLESQTA